MSDVSLTSQEERNQHSGKWWVSLPLSSNHCPSFFSISDRWGANPEFKHRKGQQPPGLISPPGFPLTLSGPCLWRGRMTGSHHLSFLLTQPAQLLLELSGLRPALSPHVTHDSFLVLFFLLGYFPSQTFFFFSFSNCFKFIQKGSSQGYISVNLDGRLSWWSGPLRDATSPWHGWRWGQVQETHLLCGVTIPWHHRVKIRSLHFLIKRIRKLLLFSLCSKNYQKVLLRDFITVF